MQTDNWHTNTQKRRPEADIENMSPQDKEYLEPEDGKINVGFFIRVHEFGNLASSS